MMKHTINIKRQLFSVLRISAVIICANYTPQSHAQMCITAGQSPRHDDTVERYQTIAFTPGTRGQSKTWDYSNLDKDKTRPMRYWQSDTLGTLACKTSGLLRYFRASGDSLLNFGYETNRLKVALDQPGLALRYPFSYGDSISSSYQGRGDLYDHTHARVFGTLSVTADAEGTLITPDGDTLRHVLRLHTHRVQGTHPNRYEQPFSPDSIPWFLSADNDAADIDTYQWYSQEYRYPIMELTTVNGSNGMQTSIAYYSPPSSMEKQEVPETMQLSIKQQDPQGTSNPKTREDNDMLADLIEDRKISRQAEGTLDISYTINKATELAVGLYTSDGKAVWTVPAKSMPSGTYSQEVTVSGLQPGVYLVRFTSKGASVTDKITLK